MNIVAHIKRRSKLKNSSPEIGYYSYTDVVFHSKKEPTVQIAHLVFADTQANPEKTKRAIF